MSNHFVDTVTKYKEKFKILWQGRSNFMHFFRLAELIDGDLKESGHIGLYGGNFSLSKFNRMWDEFWSWKSSFNEAFEEWMIILIGVKMTDGLRKIQKPDFLKDITVCEDCEECYGYLFVIVNDSIHAQCLASYLIMPLVYPDGIVKKYDLAVKALKDAGKELAELIMYAVKPVISDITYEVGGDTIYFYSEQRKNEYLNERHGMNYPLDEVVTKFLKKVYPDVKFSFDCFFGVYLTKEEAKQIRKNLKKEFRR